MRLTRDVGEPKEYQTACIVAQTKYYLCSDKAVLRSRCGERKGSERVGSGYVSPMLLNKNQIKLHQICQI